jgi:putative aldouronate transport system permease protein
VSEKKTKKGLWDKVVRDKYLLLMFLPVMAYYIIFCYIPMTGIVMAFKTGTMGHGIWGGQWIGLEWFRKFFNSIYCFRVIRNTFMLAFYSLIFGFPVPIIFALSINEIRRQSIRRIAQTVTYMPYFISTVVVVGMIVNFLATDGVINTAVIAMGGKKINFMIDPAYFRSIYVASGIWQTFGFNSVIFIAAINGISPELYESARIDGANKFSEMWHVTLPSLLPTIIVLLILAVGGILSIGFEKVYLMYNPATYETSDVLATFVYRQGIEDKNFNYASAVGLFNSVFNFIVVVAMNTLSRRAVNMSLW